MKSDRRFDKTEYKKPHSIGLLLLRYIAIFSTLLIVIFSVVGSIFTSLQFGSKAQFRLREIGLDVSEHIKQYQIEDEQALQNYVQNVEHDEIANVYIVSWQGELYAPLGIEAAQRIDWKQKVDDYTEKFAQVDPKTSMIFHDGVNYNYVEKIDYHGSSFLVVTLKFGFFGETLRTLYGVIIGVSVLALVVSLVISYVISVKVSEPLNDMAQTAKQLAKGDYSVKFAATQYQEVADLSDALNYMKDEIKKSGEFQKELLANVTHDLKTPLTMIKAYALKIQDLTGDNPEKRNKDLQVIIDETDRLAGLVTDVLSVSKISSDLAAVNKKVFNLTEFLFSVLHKFEYLSESSGYTFMIDVDQDLYTCADEEKIGQVLYNLISNAVNYTGEDKTIYISLKDDVISGRIKFKVKDTGKGIAKQDLPNIWKRYYRLSETHTRPVKGSGLGLSIVQTILQKHAFDFGVESEVGKGSTFWIDFPEITLED